MDRNGPDGQPVHLFESGAILLYFAEKFGHFIPRCAVQKYEMMNWIFWQMAGFGPMCGNYGHFMVYAPSNKCETRSYGVARYGMEVQRLCSVLDRHLAGRTYMVGQEYSIADISIYPWFHQLLTGYNHPSGVSTKTFLNMGQYIHANEWAARIAARPAVQRGMTVCNWKGVGKPWLVSKL